MPSPQSRLERRPIYTGKRTCSSQNEIAHIAARTRLVFWRIIYEPMLPRPQPRSRDGGEWNYDATATRADLRYHRAVPLNSVSRLKLSLLVSSHTRTTACKFACIRAAFNRANCWPCLSIVFLRFAVCRIANAISFRVNSEICFHRENWEVERLFYVVINGI